ncbi:MAG: hypothetical protein AAF443_08110 [Chlamydiota bacterium]
MASIQKRKNKEGKGVYRVYVRIKGSPTKTATFACKKEALAWSRKTEFLIQEDLLKPSETKHQKQSVADLIDRYLQDIIPQKLSDSQGREKERSIRDQITQLRFWKNDSNRNQQTTLTGKRSFSRRS